MQIDHFSTIDRDRCRIYGRPAHRPVSITITTIIMIILLLLLLHMNYDYCYFSMTSTHYYFLSLLFRGSSPHEVGVASRATGHRDDLGPDLVDRLVLLHVPPVQSARYLLDLQVLSRRSEAVFFSANMFPAKIFQGPLHFGKCHLSINKTLARGWAGEIQGLGRETGAPDPGSPLPTIIIWKRLHHMPVAITVLIAKLAPGLSRSPYSYMHAWR